MAADKLGDLDPMVVFRELSRIVSTHAPHPSQVHSKAVGVATAAGEYYSIYSVDLASIQSGLSWYGSEKAFLAGVICPRIYGDTDWHAHKVEEDFSISPEQFFVWGGDDCTTGCKYDPSVRPWYRTAADHGEGLTPNYGDPVTGELMRSYVLPLYDSNGVVLGCCLAGSFLNSGKFDAEQPPWLEDQTSDETVAGVSS